MTLVVEVDSPFTFQKRKEGGGEVKGRKGGRGEGGGGWARREGRGVGEKKRGVCSYSKREWCSPDGPSG